MPASEPDNAFKPNPRRGSPRLWRQTATMTTRRIVARGVAVLGALAGCMAVSSASATDPRTNAVDGIEQSPAIQMRVTQYQQAATVFDGITLLLEAEMEQVPERSSRSERALMCCRRLSPALGAFGTEATSLSDAFTLGHSCDGNSPDACWLPVFDRADQRLGAVTSQAQDLYKDLVHCRSLAM